MTSNRTHLLCGADVLTASGWQEFDLHVVDGEISGRTSAGTEVLDVSGTRIVPGFIDVQINGGWGHDLQEKPQSLWLLAERLVEVGVTSFLPTLTTNGMGCLGEALAVWRDGPPHADSFTGAQPIGWHLEGPWLAPSRHGAHRRELLRAVPAEVPPTYTPASGVRMVTMAPELTGALEAVDALARQGVVVACGHSEATARQARQAFAAGATMGTHLFNAMSGLHHRDVGLAAALMLECDYVGLIADGIHVDPDMVKLAWRVAGERLITVSDAVAATGTSAASARDGSVRLPDGTLAGGATALDGALRNLMAYTGCQIADAVRTVTSSPAGCLRLTDRGRIAVGRRADLVAMDQDGEVVLTMVGGRVVFDQR